MNSVRSTPQVQQADLGARRFTLMCLVVFAGLGTAAFVLLERYRPSLLSWFLANEPHVQVGILIVALLVLFVPLLLIAAWIWNFGGRVLRGGRHPPEGVKVIRDTPVIHGAAARRYGRLYQALAALCALAALSVLWFSWMLWRLQ
jgi:hypothetical protein